MDSKSSIWNKTYISLLIANTLLALALNIVNPLIVEYGGFLGAEAVLIGFLSGLYFGVAFLMRPISGPVITKFNRRMLLLLSFAIGAAGYLIYALFQDLGWFITARVLQGMEFSVVGSLLMALTGDSLPGEKLDTGMGIFAVANALALAIGPSIGIGLRGFGDAHMGAGGGFRLSFLAAAAIMLIALIPCSIVKPVRLSREELKEAGAWYKNIIAPQAVPHSILVALLYVSYSLLFMYMVPYAVEKGLSNIGSFFMVHAAAMLLFRPACGKIIAKFGVGPLIVAGFVIYGTSFVILGLAESMAAVYLGSILAAAGFGAVFLSLQALCLQSVPPIKRGAASNTNYFGLDLGQFLGPVLAGIVIKAFENSGRAYSILFLFGAIPSVAALLFYLGAGKAISKEAK